MTQNSTPSRPHQAAPTEPPVEVAAPPAVAAFVAAAITEHRRNHGLSQLLADLTGEDRQPADVGRGWAARDAPGVS